MELIKVLLQISKKKDIKITTTKNIIINKTKFANNDIGIKTWGRIDYLVKAHKFNIIFKK